MRFKEVSTSAAALHTGRLRRHDRSLSDGSAELLDDGSVEITFADHNGDEALKSSDPPSWQRGRFAIQSSPRP
ncbi:hypothetical protein X757_31695 [Mesorhizobium sp. LSHC414A00]|nr:hypothetical protein X757_31695 [Mesorhizobium sp. LSHC414A00]